MRQFFRFIHTFSILGIACGVQNKYLEIYYDNWQTLREDRVIAIMKILRALHESAYNKPINAKST
jgi:hypothetical protein